MNQKKKNLLLIISLISLSAITILTLYFQYSSTRLTNRKIVRQEEVEKTDRVVLESVEGIVNLTYDGRLWKVNDRFSANNQMITLLFASLENIEIKRPVAKSQADSIKNQMIKSGVKVSLYTGDEMITNFQALGNVKKTDTYIMSDGYPQLVVIPGYRVYVNYIFELPEYAWKQKRIFDFNWRNFKSLSVSFSDLSREGFIIEFKDQYFDIKGEAVSDTTRLNDFLDAVSLLEADENLPKQRIDTTSQIASFVVTDIADRKISLHIFPSDDPAYFIGSDDSENYYRIHKKRIEAINRSKNYFIRK